MCGLRWLPSTMPNDFTPRWWYRYASVGAGLTLAALLIWAYTSGFLTHQ